MALSLLAAIALAQAATSTQSRLPPSLDRELIGSCAPATIDAATDCLQRALSAEDAAALTGRWPGGGYRGGFDALLIRTWRLDEAEAPLVRHMLGRSLYADGRAAAGLLIANLGARLRGRELDWPAVTAALRRPAVERAIPVTQEASDAD